MRRGKGEGNFDPVGAARLSMRKRNQWGGTRDGGVRRTKIRLKLKTKTQIQEDRGTRGLISRGGGKKVVIFGGKVETTSHTTRTYGAKKSGGGVEKPAGRNIKTPSPPQERRQPSSRGEV